MFKRWLGLLLFPGTLAQQASSHGRCPGLGSRYIAIEECVDHRPESKKYSCAIFRLSLHLHSPPRVAGSRRSIRIFGDFLCSEFSRRCAHSPNKTPKPVLASSTLVELTAITVRTSPFALHASSDTKIVSLFIEFYDVVPPGSFGQPPNEDSLFVDNAKLMGLIRKGFLDLRHSFRSHLPVSII